MGTELRSSMQQLEGVQKCLDMVGDAEEPEEADVLITTAHVGATVAIVLAVQELTDVLRPDVVAGRRQIGWAYSDGPFKDVFHSHPDEARMEPREVSTHEACVPVWVSATTSPTTRGKP